MSEKLDYAPAPQRLDKSRPFSKLAVASIVFGGALMLVPFAGVVGLITGLLVLFSANRMRTSEILCGAIGVLAGSVGIWMTTRILLMDQ